jgi:transcriptional regulator
MYVPPLFKKDEVPALHAAMREIGLGTLVTFGSEGLVANHIPLLVDPEPAPFGTLMGHVARANPQWRAIAPGGEALALFLGPNAYVTPSWYPSKGETGKVVPTWNYVAIHAYGTPRVIDDPEWKLAHVTRLTAAHESKRSAPWAVSDAPVDFIKNMINAIVGFEMPIRRLEGKWKMSQNRPPQDRAGVVAGLVQDGAASVAAIVAATNAKSG